MGIVRSLLNQMDELTALTWHQRDFCECSIMVLTETWLTELTPDTDESGKRKGGGLAVSVNDRWCNSGHITVKEQVA